MSVLASLNARARLIFRQIVESYLETGAPVGSRLLSEVLEPQLSPASIRATMAELERSGLLYAPHVSAGRLPTQSGLRLFIDGLLQVSELTAEERDIIAPDAQADLGAEQLLKQAVDSLSGLSQCAGLVLSPGVDPIIKHIEFTPISDDQILVILVDEANQVENRVIAKPRDLLPATPHGGQQLSEHEAERAHAGKIAARGAERIGAFTHRAGRTDGADCCGGAGVLGRAR